MDNVSMEMCNRHDTELVSAGREVFNTLLYDFVSVKQVSLGDEDLTTIYLRGALESHIQDDSGYQLCIQEKLVLHP